MRGQGPPLWPADGWRFPQALAARARPPVRVARDMRPATARPRLMLATETFWPEIGGGERQAGVLANCLTALGHSITILTRRSRRELAPRERHGSALVLRLPPAGPG